MPDEDSVDTRSDMLRSLFAMQTDLNNHVFAKNAIKDEGGCALTMQRILDEVAAGRLGVNDLPNQWLVRYSQAMEAELAELKADLLWKWWSKDKIDVQNIRVELIDILHFLVSAMISAGLSPDKVYDIYTQKHAVNKARQDGGYNQATKTEDDNKGIR
jgi:dimeric dUTPase (all-alpha-NTP-PPase superfamily)